MQKMLLVSCIAICLVSTAGHVRAQSQFEMNQSAGRELKAAEAEMEALLERLFKMAESKPRSVAKLRQAQSAWQSFRDAHIKAYYPSEEAGWYGSVHPMCVAIELARLTKARVAELRTMAHKVEGDVCACQWPD